jgi:hypothetical protein
MKILLIVLFSLGFALSLPAQKTVHVPFHGGYYYRPAPRVIAGWRAYGPYPYPYYGWWGAYPFGYPYGYGYMPSKMTMEIESIKSDYHDKVVSARHDKSLSREEGKATIRELKKERDQKIEDVKSNYYKR